MAQIQYQEQEDLMADFDSSSWKEENKCSTRNLHCDSRHSTSNKVDVRKPILKPNCFKISELNVSEKKTSSEGESPPETWKNGRESGSQPELLEEESWKCGFEHCHEEFTSDSFDVLQKFFTQKAVGAVVEAVPAGLTDAYSMVKEAVREVPKHEEELKCVSCISLICYGGSWTTLAGIISAAETFGTEQVLEEAFDLGTIFFSDDSEHKLHPVEIKESLKKIGLHIALLIAVVTSPSWAELCITIALASKFTPLVPVKDMLNKAIWKFDADRQDLHECFSYIEDEWFDLLALIACNIISLTVFGCFSQFTTAMYMGYLGVSVLMETVIENLSLNTLFFSESEHTNSSFWRDNTNQFCIWGFVAAMSAWQAFYDYNGVCLFLSWLMFLHPVVQVYNMVSADSDFEEMENFKKEAY